MDVAGEFLLIGDPLEQLVELAALVLGERSEQVTLVFAGDLADDPKHFAAFAGEVKGVAAAVVLVAASLDKAAGVKGIEEGDETAGDHPQHGGERLLCDSRARAKDAQDACMGRSEIDGLHPLAESRGGVAADLGKEKSGVAAGRRARAGLTGVLFHRVIVSYKNRSELELF